MTAHASKMEPDRTTSARRPQGAGRQSPSRSAPNGPGEPLPHLVQAELERGFGVDLGAVRIHAHEPAARRLNALAFTVGRHVAFAPAAWEPTSRDGRELLAHEVAHVLQQRRGGPVVAPTRHSRLDRAADAAAAAVTGGRSGIQVDGGAAPGLARATPPGPVESSGLDTEIEVIQAWLDENPESSPERYAALEELRMLKERASSGQESAASATTAAAGPGILGTIGGALLGEFEHDPTVPMIIIDTLISFVPWVDQLADGRDILAHLYWMTDQGEYDQVLRWVGLVFSLIGCVPEIGTGIKGVSKLAIKGAREALENLDEIVALGKGLLPDGGDLRRLLAWINENWTGWVTFGQELWFRVLDHARTGLETIPGALLSSRDRLLGALGEVQQRSAAALTDAFDKVRTAVLDGMARLLDGMDPLMREMGIEPDDLGALGGRQPALAGAGAAQVTGKVDDLGPSHAHMMAAGGGGFVRPPRAKIEPPGLPPALDLIKNGHRHSGDLPTQGGPPSGVLYKQNPQTGEVTNYTLYDANGNAIKRVDLTGRSHANVPTPHVVYYADNVAPDGRVFTQQLGSVREAVPEEIP